ncbi:hypothetical protein FRC06_007051, partial [Ceratobasidium sp. 370]
RHQHPAGTFGVSEVISHINLKGERRSPSASHLPATTLSRLNLDVLVNTRTARILFDASYRAIGVAIARAVPGWSGQRSGVEVGAVGTPQILMVSEAVPKEELERRGEDCEGCAACWKQYV